MGLGLSALGQRDTNLRRNCSRKYSSPMWTKIKPSHEESVNRCGKRAAVHGSTKRSFCLVKTGLVPLSEPSKFQMRLSHVFLEDRWPNADNSKVSSAGPWIAPGGFHWKKRF